MSEIFDYEKVKIDIENLEVLFDKFAKQVRDANDVVIENINNGAGSAIYGDYGKRLLDSWDKNSSTFGDFKKNFDDWVKLVTIVGINNSAFENNISSALNQMSQEAFESSNYGKFVKSNYGGKFVNGNYVEGWDTKKDADFFEPNVAGVICTMELGDNLSFDSYNNKDGIEIRAYKDKNGNIICYETMSEPYEYYDKNGNMLTETEFTNLKNGYFAGITEPGPEQTTTVETTPAVTRDEAIAELSDGQLYYDDNVTKTRYLRTFYRNGTTSELTYVGTDKNGIDVYCKAGTNDLYYISSSTATVATSYSGSKTDFEVYNNETISSASADHDAEVAPRTFTIDPNGASRRDANYNRGGHTFQYFGTGPDGTVYYKYQSNSDNLYVFNENGRAVKFEEFDADDVIFN